MYLVVKVDPLTSVWEFLEARGEVTVINVGCMYRAPSTDVASAGDAGSSRMLLSGADDAQTCSSQYIRPYSMRHHLHELESVAVCVLSLIHISEPTRRA